MTRLVSPRWNLATAGSLSLIMALCLSVPRTWAQSESDAVEIESQTQGQSESAAAPVLRSEHPVDATLEAMEDLPLAGPLGTDREETAEIPQPAPESLAEPAETSAPVQPLNPSYVLGPGDLLSITDYSGSEDGRPQERQTLVLPDGTATIHPLGAVNVGGVTLEDINAFVNQASRSLVKHPDVQIAVVRPRQLNFYVLGEVRNPGLIEEGVTGSGRKLEAAHASVTVMGALKLAGGLTEAADVRHITVKRAGNSRVQIIDLWKLISDGDAAPDIVLQPGDVVRVPRGASADVSQLGMSAGSRVRVWGAVRRAGLYDLKPQDDILSVIAKAGGFKDLAHTRSILLSRVNLDGTITTKRINMRKGVRSPQSLARTKVLPGDLVVVDNNALIKLVLAPTNILGDVVELVSDTVMDGIAGMHSRSKSSN